MPIYELDPKNYWFPDVEEAEDGLLAIGGDLSIERLISAYKKGIFPWYSDGEPILWWSPDPRFILYLDELKISKSMRNILNKGTFKVTFDSSFEKVIQKCQQVPRKEQDGTWITSEMQDAYIQLHKAGFAHSVEVWKGENLVGGLYGVSLGRVFFGESMFSLVSNASKVALISLSKQLFEWEFEFIDCQVPTEHLKTLGAVEIDRISFIEKLATVLQYESRIGSWAR